MVTKSRKSKNREYNVLQKQRRKTNNGQHNTTQKTKDWLTGVTYNMSLRKENIFCLFYSRLSNWLTLLINLRIVITNLFFTIIDISPRIFSLMYCCCVSIIIVICILGTDLVNKFISISISIRKNCIRMVFCLFCKKNVYPALFTLLYFIILFVATSFWWGTTRSR
jgi:hypothetical protein